MMLDCWREAGLEPGQDYQLIPLIKLTESGGTAAVGHEIAKPSMLKGLRDKAVTC